MAYLTKLPSNFRFIFTCRPDSVCGEIIPIIERACKKACLFLKPHQVRVQEPGQLADQVLVYKTVTTECKLAEPFETAPTLKHLYDTYKRVFERQYSKLTTEQNLVRENIDNLLRVLLVACEPPPISLLQGLRLDQYLEHLPGWRTLFYESDNRVYFLHKSLVDWLRSDWLHARHGLDLQGGHAMLGNFLLEKEVLKTTDVLWLLKSEAAGLDEMREEYVASDYATKYAVHHLCHMDSTDSPELLESALKHWPYLKQVFKTNHGVKLLKAIAKGNPCP